MSHSLSIIVPTLQEEHGIASRIAHLKHAEEVEVVVCDGGSSDDTVAQAQKHADWVLSSPRGRARQMNLGARHARGEYLLFLHADCSLNRGFSNVIFETLADPRVIAGCFQMRIEANRYSYRLIERAASARVKCLGLIYGDQGLFLRKDDFHRLGGFPKLDFMEDLFFSRALSKQGILKVANFPIHVSPRRWQRHGVIRQSLRNWTLTALALAGVHPDRLARFYPTSPS